MEVRLLTTRSERETFVRRLQHARDLQLAHFTEVREGPIDNAARLAASELYGCFENRGDSAESMIAGTAIHDLAAFPRTCPGPELSQWSAQSVFECSDHWSLSRGAGMRIWCGTAIQLLQRSPRAILVYLAVGMSDHMGFYKAMGFVPFGEPVQFVYLKTEAGFPWVQPMILTGEALEGLRCATSQLDFEASDNFASVHFGGGLRLRPLAARERAQSVPAWAIGAPTAIQPWEMNDLNEVGMTA